MVPREECLKNMKIEDVTALKNFQLVAVVGFCEPPYFFFYFIGGIKPAGRRSFCDPAALIDEVSNLL